MREESILLGFQVKLHEERKTPDKIFSLSVTPSFFKTQNTNMSKKFMLQKHAPPRNDKHQSHSNLKTDDNSKFQYLIAGNHRFRILRHRMYPKVRVRVQQENHIPSQSDHRRLAVTKISDESISIPVKMIQSSSLPLKPRIMKASVPKVPAAQSLSSSKVDNSRQQQGKQGAKPDARACSAVLLRPRAVLSSPDNDGMIGLVNKLIDKKPSAVKVHNTKERVPAAANKRQTKTSPSAMSLTKGSNRAVLNKTGLVQSKVQKTMMGKQQQASVGNLE